MNPVHISAMPNEVIEHLVPESGDAFIIDGTLGGGGHSSLFLEQYPGARVMGIDVDPKMAERAAERLESCHDGRFECRVGWNDEIFGDWHESAPDIVLLDLGVSSYHYKEGGRGFSFSSAEPLDMRLDANGEQSASDLVNSLREEELANLIFAYGEERYSRRIARRIVEHRRKSRILKSSELADIVLSALPPKGRHGRLHPATKTFQALRIAVNRELDRLTRLLEVVPELLAPGGKFGVISFHSLEDRMVKKSFRKRDMRFGGQFEILTRKPLVPTNGECRENPPSRSAKFRVLRKPLTGGAH